MQKPAGDQATSPLATISSMEEASGQRPTTVRFIIVGLCITMAILLYVHRYAFTPVSEQIRLDFGLTNEEIGRAVSVFFLSYALLQVPAGALSDYFGARITLTAMVAIWSIALMTMGFANGLAALIFLRVLFGISQAGAYPTAAACIKRWVPLESRGKASAAVSMGGRCGGLLAFVFTPILVGWSQASHGGVEEGAWRSVFIGYGILGIVWCIFFYWLFRNSPSQHPLCNLAEREKIAGPPEAEPQAAVGQQIPMRFSAMGVANLVLLSLVNFLVNIAWIFLTTWMTAFLKDQLPDEVNFRGTLYSSKAVAGILTAIPAVGGLIGSLLGGYLTDVFLKKNGKIWGRRIPGIIACTLAGSLYIACGQTTNVWVLIPLFFAISFSIDLGLGSSWTAVQDIGGKNVGLILGICNMCGNLGAAGFGYLSGRYADAKDWNTIFYISTGSLVVTLICWLIIDPTKPIRIPVKSASY